MPGSQHRPSGPGTWLIRICCSFLCNYYVLLLTSSGNKGDPPWGSSRCLVHRRMNKKTLDSEKEEESPSVSLKEADTTNLRPGRPSRPSCSVCSFMHSHVLSMHVYAVPWTCDYFYAGNKFGKARMFVNCHLEIPKKYSSSFIEPHGTCACMCVCVCVFRCLQFTC